jgi:hypothetical protein
LAGFLAYDAIVCALVDALANIFKAQGRALNLSHEFATVCAHLQ